MNLLKFSAVIVLLTASAGLPAEQGTGQPGPDKASVLREQGNDWIAVGITQLNRGLYRQAEKSFLAAQEYQEYLMQAEIRKLQENLDKARQGNVERKTVLEYLSRARDLLNQGRPIEARAQYEKVRNSPYLTDSQREQLAGELKTVDAAFDKRRAEITHLYNRSVEFYRQGDLENARNGFAEVAKSGILVAPKGQTAEDYLIQIDGILTEQFRPPVKPVPSQTAEALPKVESTVEPPPAAVLRQQDAGVQPDSNRQTTLPQERIGEQKQTLQQEINEVEAVAETTPEKQQQAITPQEKREKLIRAYTKAVVDDSQAKVELFISQGEFDKALAAVRSAAEVVSKNRPVIGDYAFAEYAIRLKKLTDKIVEARKSQ